MAHMEANSMQLCTLHYRAPELLLGDRFFGRPVDLWSLGCVLGELCCGSPLFAAADEISVLFQVFKLLGTPGVGHLAGLPHYKTNFPNFPKAAWPPAGVPSELSAILQQCLELDPKCRISASVVRTILMDATRMRVIVEKRGRWAPERAVLVAGGLQNGWFWRPVASRTGGSGGWWAPERGAGSRTGGSGGRWAPERLVLAAGGLQNGWFWWLVGSRMDGPGGRWPSERAVL